MDAILQDLRLALRSTLRRPAFLVVAVGRTDRGQGWSGGHGNVSLTGSI